MSTWDKPMSKWFEIHKSDIDIDYDDEEVSFFVCTDAHGSIYLTLSFEQIKEIASKLDDEAEDGKD